MALIREDQETGVQLFAEPIARRIHSGDLRYSFATNTPCPDFSHHLPADQFDRDAALKAFNRIVAWLKENPA